MGRDGKWQQRRFYAKMERLLILEKKCMANLVHVEKSLHSCVESLIEDYQGKKEEDYLDPISKIKNEFNGMVKTHTQLEIKIGEAQSRLTDILRSKEDNCPELEMMLFVLESGLRQSRTGFLAALETGAKTSTPSPTLQAQARMAQRKHSITPSVIDDTMMLVTNNNPFESPTDTSTDIIDEEEEQTEGELQFEDLSVENYANPFGGLSGPQRQDDSPSPPPRAMASSANAAERCEMKSSPLILSSEKLAKAPKSSHQIGLKKTSSTTNNSELLNQLNQTPSPDGGTSSADSIKLPAVSPQATTSFLPNGELFREDEKGKKKKKKDTGKDKKKKDKKKGSRTRLSPLGGPLKKLNGRGEDSDFDMDDLSDKSSDKSASPTSPFGTRVRVAFMKGDIGQRGSGGSSFSGREKEQQQMFAGEKFAAHSSDEDRSDDGSVKMTYHNPFGGDEGGEEEEEGKKGGLPGGKKEKDKGGKKNNLLSRSSGPSLASLRGSLKPQDFSESEQGLKSMSSSPEVPPISSFVTLSEFVDLALFGDPQYRRALVLSYSHFSSAKDVIELLKEKFLEKKPDAQQKVLALVSYWLERSYFDLVSSEESLLDLIRVIQDDQEKWGKALLTKFSTKKLSFFNSGDEGHSSTLNWEGLSEGDLALAMTHSEATIFQRITPSELLAWNTKQKATHCPAIHRAIAFSTRLSGWITSEIVKRMKLKERVQLVEKFIILGEHLLEFRNFSGCMAVLGGLTSSAVWRMKKTWEYVSQDVMTTFHGLKKVMSHTSSYASYRAYLKGSNPPRIPFLGVSLSDLTFLDDGNKTRQECEEGEDELSVNKWLMLTKVLSEFQSSQSPCFNEVYPPAQGDFVKALSSHKILSELEAHRLSSFAEPKDAEEAMEEALQMYNEATKKLNSLEEELGNKDANAELPLCYSPPLYKLPENRLSFSPSKKTTTPPKARVPSPLRPVGSPLSRRTVSQPRVNA